MTGTDDPAAKPGTTLAHRAKVALAAALVGVFVGLGTIVFRESFAGLQVLLFGFNFSGGQHILRGLSLEALLLIPVLGGVAMGLMNRYLLPGRRPHGVTEVIAAADESSRPLGLRTALVAVAASTISIGTGGPVGREGPMVHLGGTIGMWLSRMFGLSHETARRMLACGVAAGVAASFNAPIAGAIFAAEVVVGHYKANAFGPIAMASVAGTVVSRLYFGELNEFEVPSIFVQSYAEIPSFLLFGIVCALVAIAFIRLPALIGSAWAKLRVPLIARPALAGLALGLIAWTWPEVLGVGYETTSAAIAGRVATLAALSIALAKLVATAIYLGSGCSGGIFSPSLMLGALLGCVWAAGAAFLFPDIASSTSTYALVGMGALAAATLGAPLSTVVIVFELTGNYPVTLAVLLATLVCSVIVNQLWGFSYFTRRLAETVAGSTRSEPIT